jgi:tetratricopeptide (TPR) repeat protein
VRRVISQAILALSLVVGGWPSAGAGDDAAWEALNRDGLTAAAEQDWPAAEEAFRQALAALTANNEGRLPPLDRITDDDARLAVVAGNLAVALLEQDELDEARALFERALLIRRAVFGTRDTALAESLNNLAELERRTGRLERSRSLHEAALEVRREVLEAGHPDIAESLNNLGVLLRDLGELDEAAALVGEAHAIRSERLGSEHRATLESAGNLATIAIDRGDVATAEAVLTAAIEAHAAAGTDDESDADPLPAFLLRSAVDVLLLRGEIERAVELCMERRGDIPEAEASDVAEAGGTSTPEDAAIVDDGAVLDDPAPLELVEAELIATCARAFSRDGDGERALSLLESGLERPAAPAEAVEAELRWELADTKAATGDLRAAEGELDTVLGLLEASGDLRQSLALNNRASIRFERGRPLDAAADLEAAIAQLDARDDAAAGPLLRDVLANYAVVLRALDRTDEALEVEDRVIDLATARADEPQPAAE